MKVEIKMVNKCRNGAFGNFIVRGRESILITISHEKNQMMAEYGATLLHELLHLWMTLLRGKKFKCSDTKEHQFIYAVERLIYQMAKSYLKPRGHK